jgi:hypothetical protein
LIVWQPLSTAIRAASAGSTAGTIALTATSVRTGAGQARSAYSRAQANHRAADSAG